MKLSIVLSTHAAQFEAATFKGDLGANMAKIRGWGYDGVELAVRDPNLVDAHDLGRLASKHRLEIPAIGTGQAWGEEGLSYSDPDPAVRAAALARTVAHVPLAKHLGAVIIVGLLRGIVKPGVSSQQAMDWIVGALRDACSEARQHGVRIALEPICRYETSLVNSLAEGVRLLDRIDAENMGLLADTFHMNIEEPVIEESLRSYGDRVFHFHVSDSNRWYPGAGHLDFRSILEVLFATGYEGYVSGEWLPRPDADTSAERGIAFLRGL